jgi:hypothetical protein
MGQQPVVAHTDSYAAEERVEQEANGHRIPSRVPKGGYRSDVDRQNEEHFMGRELVSPCRGNWRERGAGH